MHIGGPGGRYFLINRQAGMADLQAQLQAGLGGSYALERELGRGGMATVFLAHDLKHDRPVALKHQLVRIYILAGDHDAALDQLEPLLEMPYTLTPAWLRIDPMFDPIRKHPRFVKLIEGTA